MTKALFRDVRGRASLLEQFRIRSSFSHPRLDRPVPVTRLSGVGCLHRSRSGEGSARASTLPPRRLPAVSDPRMVFPRNGLPAWSGECFQRKTRRLHVRKVGAVDSRLVEPARRRTGDAGIVAGEVVGATAGVRHARRAGVGTRCPEDRSDAGGNILHLEGLDLKIVRLQLELAHSRPSVSVGRFAKSSESSMIHKSAQIDTETNSPVRDTGKSSRGRFSARASMYAPSEIVV